MPAVRRCEGLFGPSLLVVREVQVAVEFLQREPVCIVVCESLHAAASEQHSAQRPRDGERQAASEQGQDCHDTSVHPAFEQIRIAEERVPDSGVIIPAAVRNGYGFGSIAIRRVQWGFGSVTAMSVP